MLATVCVYSMNIYSSRSVQSASSTDVCLQHSPAGVWCMPVRARC